MTRLLSLTFVLLLAATSLFAQGKGNPASPHDTVKGNHITITYGRPYKKGRMIFGSEEKKALVPYGKVWRTGANEATEITVDKDCNFDGKKLKAGTYTLFTIPGEKEWTVILNTELKQWGAYGYDKVKDKDVLKATVAAKPINNMVEQFTISVVNNGIQMEWDQTSVFIPVKF